MNTLLITGISGFLGRHFAELFVDGWQVLGWRHRQDFTCPGLRIQAVDLMDTERLPGLLQKQKPDAVLHLAAASNPNFCEENPALTHRINVAASLQLARYCAERGLPFLFASTDLVFDGEQAPYVVTDRPSPISVYGRQKAEAEAGVLALHPGAGIARLPLMYGAGANFLPAWIEKGRRGEAIPAFTDEYRSPAPAADVARGLLLLLEKEVSGIWHLGGPERVSRYEFGLQMAAVFGFPQELIRPGRRADVSMPAPRPADVSLDSSESFALGYRPHDVRRGLEEVSRQG